MLYALRLRKWTQSHEIECQFVDVCGNGTYFLKVLNFKLINAIHCHKQRDNFLHFIKEGNSVEDKSYVEV